MSNSYNRKGNYSNSIATGSDDETTVMITHNMDRILTNKQTNENDRDNDPPSITQLIKEMVNLPDDYPVWHYMNPTETYRNLLSHPWDRYDRNKHS